MNDSSRPSSNTSTVIYYNRSVIENITGFPFTEHNRVRLLVSGHRTFQIILDCISAAKDIICIEFYIFKNDETGRKLAKALKEKARQGVRVYLLYDHFGSFLTSRRFWSDLKKVGIKVRVSHPFRWSAPRGYIYRNHKKLLIIDGTKAIIGGFNIADEYHGYLKKRKKTWRDTGTYLEGPIASTLLKIFNRSWTTWKGKPIQTDSKDQSFTTGVPVIPIFASSGKAKRRMRRLLIYSIRNAKESVMITTAYFNPGRRILKALVHAAQKGVDIKLLLPGKTDVMIVFYAGRAYYKRLLKAGVKIYNYKGTVLHSKAAVFDGCWSIIGSSNLDKQSLRRNEESNAGILDREFGSQLIALISNDLKDSVQVDLNTWLRRPLYQKFLEKFFSMIMKRL